MFLIKGLKNDYKRTNLKKMAGVSHPREREKHNSKKDFKKLYVYLSKTE